MSDIVNGIMNMVGNAAALIDILKAIVSGFGDVAQAMNTILYLIGKLFGG